MFEVRNLLKIGVFAKLAGTNLRTLRYYEEVGLLSPSARSSGGFRYYRETDVNRIQLIRNLQDLGITLDEIRGLLSERDAKTDRTICMSRIQGALETHEGLLDSLSMRLERQRTSIKEAREKVAQCVNCDVTPSKENNYCEPCEKTGECLPDLLSGLY